MMTSIFKLTKVAIAAVAAIHAKCGVAYEVKRHIEDDGDRVESLRGRIQKKHGLLVDDSKTLDGAPPFNLEGFHPSTINQEIVEHKPDAGILGIKTSTTTACLPLYSLCIATRNDQVVDSQCCSGMLVVLVDLSYFLD
jgi:hypothetical protein